MPAPCKLCHQVRDLRNSHVIPELCYLHAYDHAHRAQKFEADSGKRRLIQKGLREQLLCDDCESRLSKWESAFKQHWYTGSALPATVPPGLVTVSGFDYTAFKLFHLSIFWRASVATTDDFNTVDLGPYEEKIRQMLLCGNAGPEHHYPIFGQVLIGDTHTVVYGVVGKPQQSRWEHKRAYYASYAGVEWCLIISEDAVNPKLSPILAHVPKATGEMVLLQTPVEQSSTVKIFSEQYRGRRTTP